MKFISLLVILPVAALAEAGACTSGINAVAVPLLKGYPPAQSFCSAKYPLQPSTVTVKIKRRNGRTTSTTTTKPTTTKPPSTTPTTTLRTTTTTQDAKASQWSVILSQASAAISTFCSCIETPITKTVTPTTTTTTTTTTSTTEDIPVDNDTINDVNDHH
ncbi:hypothetical protein PV04_04255 [Phialophora macrospora]|uniref:Uncharacterized protein n=1 Tax=Phialophora macrospora TaxID=1851006 RepID=A0A0D2FNY6_9EURO|nr:hypothetical protein PV04_04255 [Phialophora macrospora]